MSKLSPNPETGSTLITMLNGDGYVNLDSSGNVVTSLSTVPGLYVERTATGVYTVFITKSGVSDGYGFPVFNKLVHPSLTFHANTAVALFPQFVTWTANTSFQFRLVNGSGSATTPSAPCGVSFNFRCKTSFNT